MVCYTTRINFGRKAILFKNIEGNGKNFMDEFLNEIAIEKKNERPCPTPYKCGEKILKKVKDVLFCIDNLHNHSLAIELFEKNKNNLEKDAIFYRGVKVSYSDMFLKAYDYSKSLKKMGFKKGDEVPICITNIPEFIYLFLGINFIGAKAHVVGQWFDKDYLTEILNKTGSKTMFIDDISYNDIKDAIKNSSIENLVCFSLTDSFKKNKFGESVNVYDEIDSKFHDIQSHFQEIKNDFSGNVYRNIEFEEIGKDYHEPVIENVDLDDACTITYTSGTTSPGRPKGVIQPNRSYITLSRFKESDVSGMPTMKNMSVLAHIPTYTHMEISCAISDTLYCGCTLALEPFYEKEFFPYALLINEPNFVPASTGFWGNLCKLLNFDESWKKVNMLYLMIPTVTGEGCSLGEEKFFNQTSRKHKFGTGKLPFPLAPVTFSIGGGTTESSGIFVTLFKALQEKKLNHLIKKETLGLTPHKFSEIEVLRKDGTYCEINEPGLLVANSPCEMTGYTDDELNKYTHITDAYGKEWLSLGTYSYKDTTGRIKMKGRMGNFIQMSNGTIVPYYYIEDIILADTKNIMSCSVVSDDEENLICHIEMQPYKQKSEEIVIREVIERVNCNLENEIKDNLYFRFRDNAESFPIDPSGKRSISTLRRLGMDDKTLSFDELQRKYNNNKNKVYIKSRK